MNNWERLIIPFNLCGLYYVNKSIILCTCFTKKKKKKEKEKNQLPRHAVALIDDNGAEMLNLRRTVNAIMT